MPQFNHVGRRKLTRHRLHAATDTVYRIGGIGTSSSLLRGDHQRQVSAGRAVVCPDAVVDVKSLAFNRTYSTLRECPQNISGTEIARGAAVPSDKHV